MTHTPEKLNTTHSHKNYYKIKDLDLAEKIRLSILGRGWTYTTVAKALGVQCATITYWCSGECLPTDEHKNDLISLFKSVPLPSFEVTDEDFQKPE